MTAAVWFSHPPDYGKLTASVARVRELDPEAWTVAVIDPAHQPPPIPGLSIIRKAFNRGTHLDGAECVHGVVESLAEIPAEMVVKIDSDMVPATAFWKDGPSVFQRWNNFYVGLYALPAEVMQVVKRCLRDQPNPGNHEAIAICGRAVVAMHALGIPFNHHRLPQGVFIPALLTT